MKMIDEKIFVTNNHVLVQFLDSNVPLTDEKGKVMRGYDNKVKPANRNHGVILDLYGHIVN